MRNRPIFAKELDAWLEESEGWRSGVLSAVRGISVAEFHIFDTLDGLPDTVYPSSTLTRYEEFGEPFYDGDHLRIQRTISKMTELLVDFMRRIEAGNFDA